jgi:hypothetical protein
MSVPFLGGLENFLEEGISLTWKKVELMAKKLSLLPEVAARPDGGS